MSLLQHVNPETATGPVANIYSQFQAHLGFIPRAAQAFSASPVLLEQQWAYMSYYLEHETFSPQFLAIIRLLTSDVQPCDYCINFNEGLLINHLGLSTEEVKAVRDAPESAPLNYKEKTLLLLVIKAMNHAKSINAEDMQAARDAGNSDREILEALHHGARQQALNLVISSVKLENEF